MNVPGCTNLPVGNTLRQPDFWFPIQDPVSFTDISPIRSHICRVGGEMLNTGFVTGQRFEHTDQVIDLDHFMPTQVDDLVPQGF